MNLRIGGAIVLVASLSTSVYAAPTPEQATQAKTVSAKLKKAGNLYQSNKIKEAAAALREAHTALNELLSTGDVKEAVALAKPLRANLEKAEQLLELEGQKFEALPTLPEVTVAKPGDKPAPAQATSGAVSFVKQVAPVLIRKCGGCHVGQAKGGFSMSTFAALQKGSKEGGIVVQAGSSQGSRMVELIQSGDMPRGGGKVSEAELALLCKWIDQGAKFDGPDAEASLSGLVAAELRNSSEMIKVQEATGKEDVLFARDVGPVIVAKCINCHGANNPKGRLSLISFNGMLNGGGTGPIIAPGNPTDSLLIQKLRGTAGARMPFLKPALEEEVIAKFEKWIADGAKFDGPDRAMPLEEVVQIRFAERANHAELTPERAKIARRNWKITQPDAQTSEHESDNLLVIGNISEELLVDVAKTAEDLVPRIGKMLGAPADKPFIKGRLTIFAFEKRYDYGEIGTMIESREIPSASRGHWRYTIIDAYACIVPPRRGEAQPLDSLLAQQIAGAYVASLGRVPRWFAEGSGRVIASRINPKDPRFKEWDNRLYEIIASGGKGDVAVNGSLPAEEADIAAYGFVKALAANGAKFTSLLNALRAGTAFDQAFAQAYGAVPLQVAGTWVPKAPKGRR